MRAVLVARRILPIRIRRRLLSAFERLQAISLQAAAREQALDGVARRLAGIVPDLTGQYTTFAVSGAMLRVKVRTQHAFQIALALRAVARVLERQRGGGAGDGVLRIVDVGDSAGTHLTYLKTLLGEDHRLAGRILECVGVNLDPAAVDRIRGRGLPAILGRAEDVVARGAIEAQVALCFEMLEHMADPISFLDTLSRSGRCACFVLTVPYLRRSRVGLHHIRRAERRAVTPENTHIFELSPEDWKLLFAHAGWAVSEEQVYRQYPRHSWWRVMQPAWRWFDFEGFYGAILEPDRTWADLYHA